MQLEVKFIKKSDETDIQSSEMEFLRSVKGCSIMDKIRNEDIIKELKFIPIFVKIRNLEQTFGTFGTNGQKSLSKNSQEVQAQGEKEQRKADKLRLEEAYSFQP